MNIEDKLRTVGKVEIILRNVKTGKIKYQKTHNLVTTVGKNSIADSLRGTASKGEITYCALGTDSTAPAVGNTTLGTEIFRKAISVRSVTANAALFETFFAVSEGNGTLREAGLFGDDASATTDSGTLFCHTAISRTKTSSDTLSLRWTFTVG